METTHEFALRQMAYGTMEDLGYICKVYLNNYFLEWIF
jgi:hypothetical protein